MGNQDEANKRKRILRVIDKIVNLTSGGEYIYRGQSDADYPHVESSLYRELCRELKKRRPKEKGEKLREWKAWQDMEHNMNLVQEETLEAARKFTNEGYNNDEMLSRIQHYSGDTNLIDFTKDYLVALFFACNQKYGKKKDGGKNGEVFLLEISNLKNSEKNSEVEIITPVHPFNLVTVQKSVFVQSRKGFILKKDMKVVSISPDLKQPILDYLKEHHDISLSTMYNDLHGYIRNSKEYGDAIMEFYLGLNYSYKYNNAQSPEEKKDAATKAMGHFDKVIFLDPKYVRAYKNRGNANLARGEAKEKLGDASGAKNDYNVAVTYYDKAIALDPDYAMTYNNRGIAKQECGSAKRKLGDVLGAISDYKDAISDYDKAIALNPNYPNAYSNRGTAKRNYGNVKQELDDVLIAISDYKDAINDFDKAIKLAPNRARAYNNRGIAKANCGGAKRKFSDESGAINDYRDAISDYDKAIALDPILAAAYSNRGFAKEALGDRQNLKQALSDFRYAKRLALRQNRKDVEDEAQEGIERVKEKMCDA